MSRFSTSSILCGVLSCSSALAAKDFSIPLNTHLTWSGQDSVSGEACTLDVQTDEGGKITSLLLTASYKGFALTPPADLSPTGSGYAGTVDLFRNYSYSTFRYEPHVFSKGLTLIAPGSGLGGDKRRMSLFGDSLPELKRVVYKDHNAFARLDGECRDLELF